MDLPRFGTDGWRAVIARDFTYDTLETVARATAKWLLDTQGEKPGASGAPSVVLGHDTRYQGRAFSLHVARVMASEGVRVLLADTVAPTPALSWAAEAYGVNAAIVITASHNPPSYNGFKIKAYFGGPATPAMIEAVEARMEASAGAALPTEHDLRRDGLLENRPVTADYLAALRERLDLAGIRAAGITVAHDAMYGAGRTLIAELLGDDAVVGLHQDLNPGMMDQAPEPIEKNLGDLARAVVDNGCAIGLANDGDADRIGLYDENGQFVDSHRLFCLLVKYLHQERGLSGSIVKTFSTTSLLDKIGAAYGLPVETTKIGFKYIAEKIVDGDVLVGGEESGGMAVKGHIPERDGLYIGLLATEMMVRRGKSLSALVEELFAEFGPHVAARIDVHTTHDTVQAVLATLKGGGLKTIAGQAVTEVQTLDGFKHVTDGGWLLVRPSGTEPVLRIYAEAPDRETADAMLHDAAAQLGVSDAH